MKPLMKKYTLTEQEVHECKFLEDQSEERFLQVLKIENEWYFITYNKEGYGIRNCPYCGKLLREELV